MARFLIEAHHDRATLACERVVKLFHTTGSHYLTHAEWGCLDGHHTAWLMVDVETREQARALLPPAFRAGAKVVALSRFGPEDLDWIVLQHQAAEV